MCGICNYLLLTLILPVRYEVQSTLQDHGNRTFVDRVVLFTPFSILQTQAHNLPLPSLPGQKSILPVLSFLTHGNVALVVC